MNRDELIQALAAKRDTTKGRIAVMEWRQAQQYSEATAGTITASKQILEGIDLKIAAAKGDESAIALLKPSVEAMANLYKDLATGGAAGVKAHAEIVAIRSQLVNNHIMASSMFAPFFNVINLADNERAEYKLTTRDFEVGVRVIGANGALPRQSQPVRENAHVGVPMYPLSTDRLEHPLWDVDRGVLSDQAMYMAMAQEDLEAKVDGLLQAVVLAAPGAFDVTDAVKAKRTYTAHSRINTANFPSTSRLVADTTGRWSWEAIKAIFAYCKKWSTYAPASNGAPMMPMEIHIPSLDASGMLEDVTPTTQVTPGSLSAQIVQTGNIEGVAGQQFILQPNPMLDPTAGFAYVRTNLPIGDLYFKPGMSAMLNEITADNFGNKGTMRFGKYMGICVPNFGITRVIRVKYK